MDVETATGAATAQVVGTAVGLATDGEPLGGAVAPGDALIGIPGDGAFGPALDRALSALDGDVALDETLRGQTSTVGEALGTPARVGTYLLDTIGAHEVHAAFHLADNGVAALEGASDLGYEITDPLPVPPVFETIRAASGRTRPDLYRALALGTGMVLAVADGDAAAVCEETDGKKIGRVTDGGGVRIRGLTVAED